MHRWYTPPMYCPVNQHIIKAKEKKVHFWLHLQYLLSWFKLYLLISDISLGAN